MTREEAIQRFNGIIHSMSISVAQAKFYPTKAELDELCNMAIEALSAEAVQGEWIKYNDRNTIITYYICSECGEVESGTPPYCRKCGAKMGSDTR